MKAHIGVDAQSGLVHTVVATAANVNDVTQAGALQHRQESVAFGDAGYRGVHKREEAQGRRWHVAMQPRKRRQLDLTRKWARRLDKAEQLKASARAKVEHPFHVIKNLFRHKASRYKGRAKNEAQLFSLLGWPIWSSPRGRCWPLMPEVRLERRKWPRKRRETHRGSTLTA